MTHSEALKLALDALGKFSIGYHVDAVQLNDLIATLEAALEQPEQEPKSTWQKLYEAAIDQRNEAHAVNQELLEALKALLPGAKAMGWDTDKARAAIAKAEGQA